MMKFLKEFIPFVICCLSIFALFYLAYVMGEESRQEAQFCYSKNMVVASTDAGHRCAVPSLLVPIK